MTITPEIPWWLEKGDRGHREVKKSSKAQRDTTVGGFVGGFVELLQRRFSLELRKELEPEVSGEGGASKMQISEPGSVTNFVF
jgi:hypothetical protein